MALPLGVRTVILALGYVDPKRGPSGDLQRFASLPNTITASSIGFWGWKTRKRSFKEDTLWLLLCQILMLEMENKESVTSI